jgi:hypothetical protein
VPYHVRVSTWSTRSRDEVRLDLSREELESRFLQPYREGQPIVIGGRTIPPADLERLRINYTDEPSSQLRPIVEAERRNSAVVPWMIPIEWDIANKGRDISDELVTGPAGSDLPSAPSSVGRQSANRQPHVYSQTEAKEQLQSAFVQLNAIRGTFAREQEGVFKRQQAYRYWWGDTRSALLRLFDDGSIADQVLPSAPAFVPASASVTLQFQDVDGQLDRSRDRLGALLNGMDTFPEVDSTEGIANVPPEPKRSGMLVSPSTPYRNKVALAELVASAKETLSWFDAHLDRKALRFLYEEVTAPGLSTIRMLTCGRSVLDAATLDDYRRCRTELAGRRVSLEWRTLVDRDGIDDKHDRWLCVDGVWWNVPPFGAVMTGKHGSLLVDPNAPPFDEWWENAAELTQIKAGG